jgi:hypothetical protein
LEKPQFHAPEPADLSDFRIGNTLVIASDIPPSMDDLEPRDINEMSDKKNQYPILFTLNF